MSCFSCKQTSVRTEGPAPLSDELSDKLNSMFKLVGSTEHVCIIDFEGVLKSSRSRTDSEVILSSDTIYTIASLKSALDRFLKIFLFSGCTVIHISGDYYIFSFYIINAQHILVFLHQLDPTCGMVADFSVLDNSIIPFLEDLKNTIALSV